LEIWDVSTTKDYSTLDLIDQAADDSSGRDEINCGLEELARCSSDCSRWLEEMQVGAFRFDPISPACRDQATKESPRLVRPLGQGLGMNAWQMKNMVMRQ
jgi:hypothetical protein